MKRRPWHAYRQRKISALLFTVITCVLFLSALVTLWTIFYGAKVSRFWHEVPTASEHLDESLEQWLPVPFCLSLNERAQVLGQTNCKDIYAQRRWLKHWPCGIRNLNSNGWNPKVLQAEPRASAIALSTELSQIQCRHIVIDFRQLNSTGSESFGEWITTFVKELHTRIPNLYFSIAVQSQASNSDVVDWRGLCGIADELLLMTNSSALKQVELILEHALAQCSAGKLRLGVSSAQAKTARDEIIASAEKHGVMKFFLTEPKAPLGLPAKLLQ